MNDQFVTYDIAKKLQDLGFDEPCLAVLGTNGIFKYAHNISQFSPMKNSQTSGLLPVAPLWQQAIDWLRMKHGIIITIDLYNWPDGWIYEIKQWMNGGENSGRHQFTYEQAREKAVLRALELIDQKNKPS